jgi:lipopolysaccharide export system permease protein
MKTLQRYILIELAGPFAFSLGLLTFILFMRHMVFLFPKIAGKGLELRVVAELMVLSLPFIIALVVPMAVLVAVIMAFGRLSSDNEIVSLKAVGISEHSLMKAPLAAAVVLILFSVWFNDRILPESNHMYKSLLTDIAYLKPTLSLREGVIMDEFPGMGILVNRIAEKSGLSSLDPTVPGDFVKDNQAMEIEDNPEGAANMFGIIISETGDQFLKRTIVADSGQIRFLPNREDALLVLFHGEIQEVDTRSQKQFRRTFFERHQVLLPKAGGTLERGRSRRYRSDRELSIAMLEERITRRETEIDSLWQEVSAALDSLGPGDSIAVVLKGLFGPEPLEELRKSRSVPEVLARYKPSTFIRLQENPRFQLSSTLRKISIVRRRIAALKVEVWKKIAIPCSSVVFVLLGIPLGIITRRGGMGLAISISMGIFLIYWVSLIAGETLADRMLMSPFWAMWSPNALFLLVGIWLIFIQIRGTRSLAVAHGGLLDGFRKRFGGKTQPDKDSAEQAGGAEP